MCFFRYKILYWLFVIICITGRPNVYSQNIFNGGHSSAMAGMSSLQTGTWASCSNPAGLSEIQHRLSIALSHYSLYGIKDLSANTVATAGLLSKNSGAGLWIANSGLEKFRDITGGVSYGHGITPELSAGVGIGFLQKQTVYEPSEGFIPNVSTGLMWNPNKYWHTGIYGIYNEQNDVVKLEKYKIKGSLGYGDYEKYLLAIEYETADGYKSIWRSGMFFTPINPLKILCGFSNGPHPWSMGVGYEINRMYIQFSFIQHNSLGGTLAISAEAKLFK